MAEKSVMKIFRLSEEENEDFKRKAKKALMPEARLIRLLIAGYHPPEAPGDEFFDDMNRLLAVAEGLHEIAKRSRSADVKELLEQESKQLHGLRVELKKKYLSGERKNIKWQ